MGGLRRVQILKNNKWVDFELNYLRIGHEFRMFEPTGEVVFNRKGGTRWVVTSLPKSTSAEGVLALEVDELGD